jgi:hypothetical protein
MSAYFITLPFGMKKPFKSIHCANILMGKHEYNEGEIMTVINCPALLWLLNCHQLMATPFHKYIRKMKLLVN